MFSGSLDGLLFFSGFSPVQDPIRSTHLNEALKTRRHLSPAQSVSQTLPLFHIADNGVGGSFDFFLDSEDSRGVVGRGFCVLGWFGLIEEGWLRLMVSGCFRVVGGFFFRNVRR